MSKKVTLILSQTIEDFLIAVHLQEKQFASLPDFYREKAEGGWAFNCEGLSPQSLSLVTNPHSSSKNENM